MGFATQQRQRNYGGGDQSGVRVAAPTRHALGSLVVGVKFSTKTHMAFAIFVNFVGILRHL